MCKTIFNFILFGLGTCIIGFSCSNHDPSNQESTQNNAESQDLENEPYVNYDSIWLEEFVAFRDAVYRQDLQAIKGFVDFPMEPGLIWDLAYSEDSPEYQSAVKNNSPFTEKHFDATYKKIFSPDFTKCILKVKSKELFEKGEYSTQRLIKDNVTHFIIADYRTDDFTLRLSLLKHTLIIFDDDDSEPFNAESSVIYFFKLINNKLKFTGVQMAG